MTDGLDFLDATACAAGDPCTLGNKLRA